MSHSVDAGTASEIGRCDSTSSVLPPAHRVSTFTSGMLLCVMKLCSTRSTGFFVAAASVVQKPSPVALANANFFRYALMPSRIARRADVALDHPDDGGGLLIRNRVEHLVDLVRRLDLRADGPRRAQRVEVHRALRVAHLVERAVPFGLPFLPSGGAPSRSRTPRSARCRPTTPS